MNPQELSAYITTLLRSGPEVIASFLMGVFLTAMLVFGLRRWLFPGRDIDNALARKDAEIARINAEVTRRDAQIAGVEVKLAILESRLSEKDEPVASLCQDNEALLAISAITPSGPAQDKVSATRLAELEAENRQLAQDKHSLEETVRSLRTELAQVSAELAHQAKWLKMLEEENARLTESGSLAER